MKVDMNIFRNYKDMTKAEKLIHLIEQNDDSIERDNGADAVPPALDLADKLLGGLNIKPKISKAKPLPSEFTVTFKEVDGEMVRDEHDQNFTEGGNWAAYPEYIPEGECWWEAGHPLEGKLGTICHEFPEAMIIDYLGWDYDSTHTLCANPIEAVIRWACRQTPSSVEESFIFKEKATPEVEWWIMIFENNIKQKILDEAKKK
jgi:hypothetical protein